jgi:hypothetical protein
MERINYWFRLACFAGVKHKDAPIRAFFRSLKRAVELELIGLIESQPDGVYMLIMHKRYRRMMIRRAVGDLVSVMSGFLLGLALMVVLSS